MLKDIDFSVSSGETIGVLGGTGSAKSSLVSLISRLYDVTAGQVLVGGRDVREYDMEALRNQVSVVLQKNVLFSCFCLFILPSGQKLIHRDPEQPYGNIRIPVLICDPDGRASKEPAYRAVCPDIRKRCFLLLGCMDFVPDRTE